MFKQNLIIYFFIFHVSFNLLIYLNQHPLYCFSRLGTSLFNWYTNLIWPLGNKSKIIVATPSISIWLPLPSASGVLILILRKSTDYDKDLKFMMSKFENLLKLSWWKNESIPLKILFENTEHTKYKSPKQRLSFKKKVEFLSFIKRAI